jgi:hypothetical protein
MSYATAPVPDGGGSVNTKSSQVERPRHHIYIDRSYNVLTVKSFYDYLAMITLSLPHVSPYARIDGS